MSLRIRQAEPADLPQMMAMDQQLFGAYGADEDPAVLRARLDVYPAGCMVMEEISTEGRPVAFLGYLTTEKWASVREPALDEDPHTTHNPDGRILNITTLAIGRAFQNRGLGPQLLEQAVALARRQRCTQIILETAHAERFYRRHGFEKIGERQQRGITLQIMRLKLAGIDEG